ncbi:MAG: hypothetical protein FWC95_00130 [Defluviitaleaceae bacterium]|nr:hypothetical protein [Defluviitaleaceae bacterium]
MKKFMRYISILIVTIVLSIGFSISLTAGGGDPVLPPLPPCPIYGIDGRSIDPCGPYTDEK